MIFWPGGNRLYFTTRIAARTLLVLALFAPGMVSAQSAVTFQLNLTNSINHHIFNPETDRAELLGNVAPLSMDEGAILKPLPSSETIYAITIEFPAAALGEQLTYRFALQLAGTYVMDNPDASRRLVLARGRRTLPPEDFGVEFELFDSYRHPEIPFFYGVLNPPIPHRKVHVNSSIRSRGFSFTKTIQDIYINTE